MAEIRLAAVESRFADIIWAHAPIASRELARVCEGELGGKRTTTCANCATAEFLKTTAALCAHA